MHTLQGDASLQAALAYSIGDWSSSRGQATCIQAPPLTNMTLAQLASRNQKQSIIITRATLRCFPSFSIIGLPKRGTSALYFYLHRHPSVRAVVPFYKKERCPTLAVFATPEENAAAYWAEMMPTQPQHVVARPETMGFLPAGAVWGDACIHAAGYEGGSFLNGFKEAVPRNPYWSLANVYAEVVSKHSLLILLVGEPIGRGPFPSNTVTVARCPYGSFRLSCTFKVSSILQAGSVLISIIA